VELNKAIDKSTTTGPLAFSNNMGMATASIIMSYIAVCIPVIPFIFLITSWFIGINGVYKSKLFHYFLWGTLLASLVFMLCDTVMAGIVLDQCNSFNYPTPAPAD